MISTSVKSAKRRTEIVEVALELFFERGFDGTSIRMIQDKLNSPVGLFYYYFESKDAVFEEAIKYFFKDYEKKMQVFVDSSEEFSGKELSAFIDYMQKEIVDFRVKYLGKLHWSILGAIREYSLRVMRKYVREILCKYRKNMFWGDGLSETEVEVIADMIAFGSGGNMLYQDDNTYQSRKPEVLKYVSKILGTEKF